MPDDTGVGVAVGGFEHTPAEQICELLHVLPQEPQLCTSFRRSTHTRLLELLQLVSPVGHIAGVEVEVGVGVAVWLEVPIAVGVGVAVLPVLVGAGVGVAAGVAVGLGIADSGNANASTRELPVSAIARSSL